jgi:positive regulator of sigma E activity
VKMLETRAIIVQVEGQYALVQASQANGCEQCSGKGCGAGKLSQLFCSKRRLFQVDNSINAGVGDEVVISVAEGAILRGIGLVYLLPLLLLVIGALVGSAWAGQSPEQQDGYATAGAWLPASLSQNGFHWAKPEIVPSPILHDHGVKNRESI